MRPDVQDDSGGLAGPAPEPTGPGVAAARGRLAVVLSHPTQYYSPWFRELTARPELDLRVFYLWDFGVTARRDPGFGAKFAWDVDLLSGYAHEFVPNIARDPGTHHFGGLRNPTLTARLAAWQPDAVLLFGYSWMSHLRVIVWARRTGTPLLFRGDSHFLGRGAPPWPKRRLLQAIYARMTAILTVGSANRDYFLRLGVPAARLHPAPHSVDASRFAPTDEVRTAAAALRARLGLAPTAQVVLFAGKLIPAKQPRELLEAFLALDRTDAALLFVGDGSEKAALETTARAHAATRVFFLPFANQSEMPSRYLAADLFVLPSRGHHETWGLAVNEAMHLGVPCLVSDLVGCQRDLVTDGETGWVFHAGDRSDLQGKLSAALAELAIPARRRQVREAVEQRIARYTYEFTTAGLLTAWRRAVHGVSA